MFLSAGAGHKKVGEVSEKNAGEEGESLKESEDIFECGGKKPKRRRDGTQHPQSVTTLLMFNSTV